MRAHVDIELRWGDQDAYGHINNVAFARYVEEARVRLFWYGTGREQTGLEQFFRGDVPGGPMMLVANQQLEFLRVLEYSEHPLVIEAWIGKLGGSSLEIHCELLDASGEPAARAITTIVMVDRDTQRPTRLSPEGRAAVQLWMDEPLQLRRS